MSLGFCLCASAQSARSQESVEQKIERLDGQMSRVQAQLEKSEQELKEIQQQLSTLRSQAGLSGSEGAQDDTAISGAARQLAAAVNELREKQDVLESQAAAQEQAKVGSESRYSVTLSGMILFSGFVNTHTRSTAAPTPSIAFLPGPGATGALRLRDQTVLGIDASGPHIFGSRKSCQGSSHGFRRLGQPERKLHKRDWSLALKKSGTHAERIGSIH